MTMMKPVLILLLEAIRARPAEKAPGTRGALFHGRTRTKNALLLLGLWSQESPSLEPFNESSVLSGWGEWRLVSCGGWSR